MYDKEKFCLLLRLEIGSLEPGRAVLHVLFMCMIGMAMMMKLL